MCWLISPVELSPVLMVRSEFSSQIKERSGLRGMNARQRDEGRGERCESGRGRKKRGKLGKNGDFCIEPGSSSARYTAAARPSPLSPSPQLQVLVDNKAVNLLRWIKGSHPYGSFTARMSYCHYLDSSIAKPLI